MPTFEFKSPEGKTYSVSGPDGATPEQAFEQLQGELARKAENAKPEAAPGAEEEGFWANAKRRGKAAIEETGKEVLQAQGPFEAAYKGMKPIAEAALSGPAYLGNKIKAGLLGGASALSEGILGSKDFDKAVSVGAEKVKQVQKEAWTPKTIGGQLISDLMAAPGSKALEAIKQSAGEAGMEPLGSVAEAGLDTLGVLGLGKGAAPAIRGAGTLMKEAGLQAFPKLTREAADKAALAEEKGIRLNVGSLYQNRAAELFHDMADSLWGMGGSKKANHLTMNKLLTDLVGGESENGLLTQQVWAKAAGKSGKGIEESFGKVHWDGVDLTPGIEGVMSDWRNRTSDAARTVTSEGLKILTDIEKNRGKLPANLARKINTDLKDMIEKQPETDYGSEVKSGLLGLRTVFLDQIERGLSPADLAAYKKYRQQYAIAMDLKPAIGSAEADLAGLDLQRLPGLVSRGKQGTNRVAWGTAGELGDLASIVKNFMPEDATIYSNLGSFGPWAKPAAYAAAGGAGLAYPTALLGGITAAKVYNHFGPKVARALIEKYKSKPTGDAPPAGPPRIAGLLPELDENGNPIRSKIATSGDLAPDWVPGKDSTVRFHPEEAPKKISESRKALEDKSAKARLGHRLANTTPLDEGFSE